MQQIRWIVTPLLIGVLLAGCGFRSGATPRVIQGSGTVAQDERSVSGYNAIELDVNASVKITQGDSEGVQLSGDDNIVPAIRTDVQSNKLIIKTDPGVTYQPKNPVQVTVRVRDLDSIVVNGAGQISAPSLTSKSFNLTLNGSGSAKFDKLTAQDLTARINGSGEFTAAGSVPKQTLTVTGSGKYSARELAAVEANVTISGSGEVTARVSDKLDVKITGNGTVNYAGNPQITQNITGAGQINKIADN